MESKTRNKFRAAHYELVGFCNKCQSDEKVTCDQINATCDKLNWRIKELYYEKLYPFHPCGMCLVRGSCQGKFSCDEYWFYYHSRDIANCELTDNVSFFTSDRSPFISGHRLAITREYINSDPRLKKIIDFDVTEKYITEMKNSVYFNQLLDTVRQYLEYCAFAESNRGQRFFKDEFF
jgi:hypothetical protein